MAEAARGVIPVIEYGTRVTIKLPKKLIDMSKYSLSWNDAVEKIDGHECTITDVPKAFTVDGIAHEGYYVNKHKGIGGIWIPTAWLVIPEPRQGMLFND